MAKQTGMGITTLEVDDSGGVARAIINDVTNFAINTPSGIQDVTGVDKSAMERLHLLGDGQVPLNGVFNNAASTGSHTVLKNYRTLAASQLGRTVTFTIPTSNTIAMEMIGDAYNVTRAPDGSLVWTMTMNLSNGTVPAWS